MEHPVLNRFFKVFGLVYSNFDQNSHQYVLSSRLQLYAIFITIFIQSSCSFVFYCRMKIIQELTSSTTSKISIICNWFLWVILSTVFMFRIIALASRFCKFTNKCYACFSQSGNVEIDSIHFLHKFFAVAMIFGTPISICIFYGFSKQTIFRSIAYYFLSSQFFMGHMYEWTLFGRLNLAFVKLQANFMLCCDHKPLWECFKRHMCYVDLVKRLTKLFELNKMVGVVGFFISLSFYWFYSFEYITTRSTEKQVGVF